MEILSAIEGNLWHFLTFFIGVHNRRVLQAELEGREIEVRGADEHFASEQPDGQQNLDSGHFLSQREEISGTQHDHAQQATAHPGWWNIALHNEVVISLHFLHLD